MSSDYGYINARIRAMRSLLFREEDYLEALRLRHLDEFSSYLSSQPSYVTDLRYALTSLPARFACDEGLKLNLCRIFRKILGFCEGEPKRLIAFLLTHWDIYNLKTIIRGITSFKDKIEIIRALIPAGRWDLEFLSRLAEAGDLKALALRLRSVPTLSLSNGLANNLAVSSEDDFEKELAGLINGSQGTPLEILENSLQEVYFKKAKDHLEKGNNNAHLVWDYLSLQIDFLNILSVLRKITQASASINFIQGGRLPEGFLKDLSLLKSVEGALKSCERSSYSWLSQEGLNLYKRSQRLSSLERVFKKRQLSFCSKLYTTGDPLSIGIPLAFINFKENEIGNLRFIGKAIHFGIPQDKVLEEIIFAG